MRRLPPVSTLFPSRRSSDLWLMTSPRCAVNTCPRSFDEYSPPSLPTIMRSEEHTSELQSHSELVCRLLLEKKKERRQLREPKRFGGHDPLDRMASIEEVIQG